MMVEMVNRMKAKKRCCFIAGLVLFLSTRNVVIAQNQLPHFTCRSVIMPREIPGKTVFFAYQDRTGVMWFGTGQGLVRYNGFRKEVFGLQKGAAARLIFEDRSGAIWFVSGKNMLRRIRNGIVSNYRYNQLLASGLKKNRDSIVKFAVDETGNLWCQTGMTGTIQIDKSGQLKRIQAGSEGGSLTQFENQYFAVSAKSPVMYQSYRISIRNRMRTRQTAFSFLENKETSKSQIALELKAGNENEIVRINDCFFDVSKPGEVLCLQDVKSYCLIDSDLWVMTSDQTLRFRNVKKDGLNRAKREIYFRGIEVTSVMRDLEGAYWFSTREKGVYYLANDRIKNILVSGTTGENNVHYLLFDKKKRLIYGNVKGVFALHDPVPYIVNVDFTYPGLTLLGDKLVGSKGLTPRGKREGGIAVGHFSDEINEGDTTLLLCSNDVKRVNRQGKETYLYRINQGGKRSTQFIGYFETISTSDDGTIFVGNVKGLFRIENKRHNRKGIPAVLQRVRVSHMRFSPKLGMVIATRGKGIYVFKNNRIVKQVTSKDGLIDDQINRILLEPNGTVCWVATNSGISKLVFTDNYQVRIRNVTELDGLMSSEVNDLELYRDTIYASTKKGISIIPGNIDFLDNKLKKQVTVDRVEADGMVIPLKKNRVSITSGANRIVIVLKSGHFRRMGKQLLRYRFNRNEEWTYSNSGVIVFYDLNRGEHQMELSYLDKTGTWQKPYVLFTLVKKPGFTETVWFDLLLVLLSFSVGFFLIRRRVLQLNKRREFKRQIQVMEQKALLAQMNPHFVFSALNSIQDFLVRDENELAERYLTRLSQLIRMILVNSREGIVSIEKEIDLLKKYLELERIRFKNSFDIQFNVSIDLQNQWKLIPPMLVQPFIESILMHSFEDVSGGGIIQVNYSIPEAGILNVEIEHNGSWHDGSNHSDSEVIAMERLHLFTEKYRSVFQYTIQKKTDASGAYTGTRLELRIPIIERQNV